MAEKEAEHRRILETAIVRAGTAESEREASDARRGQIFALIVVITSIGGCIYLAVNGHDGAASALGLGGTLSSVVTTFIIGRQRKGNGTSQH